MSTPSLWSGVAVAIQSALGTARNIASISKALPASVNTDFGSPTVLHGFTTGDYVAISALGMNEVNGRVFRVTVTSTSAFTLDSEDSSLYSTFTSGTATLITFGNTMTTAQGLSASGGDFDFIDITTIHDTIKSQIPGAASPAVYSFESIWDPADAGLVALKAAADIKGLRAVKFTFAGGQKVAFNGYIGCTLLPTGQGQQLVTTPVTVTMFGRPSIYSS